MSKYVVMITSDLERQVRIRDVPQGTEKQMIAIAKRKAGKYLKLFETPVKFVVREE